VVLALAIDIKGNKWFGTTKGLAKLDGKDWTVYNARNSELRDDYILSLNIDKHGNIWIGTLKGGLAKFDGDNWKVYKRWDFKLKDECITCIYFDVQGNKWIGTCKGGLAKFDGLNWTAYNVDNTAHLENVVKCLVNTKILCLASNSENNVWIGTSDSGLVKFNGVDCMVYNKHNSGLPRNYVWDIATDKEGNIWIACGNGGLARFDGENWSVYSTEQYRSLYSFDFGIFQIFGFDKKGWIWIETDKGLAYLLYPHSSFFNFLDTPKSWLHMVGTIDLLGNLWIGSIHSLWELNTSKNYNKDNSGMPGGHVKALSVDSQNNLWIGTNNGLVKFNGQKWNNYNSNNSGLPNNEINSIAIDAKDILWIGTERGGMARFDGHEWTVYDKDNSELPSNRIDVIVIDALGNKWIDAGILVTYQKGGVIFSSSK